MDIDLSTMGYMVSVIYKRINYFKFIFIFFNFCIYQKQYILKNKQMHVYLYLQYLLTVF